MLLVETLTDFMKHLGEGLERVTDPGQHIWDGLTFVCDEELTKRMHGIELTVKIKPL